MFSVGYKPREEPLQQALHYLSPCIQTWGLVLLLLNNIWNYQVRVLGTVSLSDKKSNVSKSENNRNASFFFLNQDVYNMHYREREF